MQRLNLPEYPLKIRSSEGRSEIFDVIRRKYVALTPEEWVRQHLMHYLINEKGVPQSLIAVEKTLKVHQRTKRTDLVVYTNMGKPVILVECKSPVTKISQETFDQIVRYNYSLQVKYLLVSNGLQHYCCLIDYYNQTYSYIPEIPDYRMIEK